LRSAFKLVPVVIRPSFKVITNGNAVHPSSDNK
jgi:hypothetical protein